MPIPTILEESDERLVIHVSVSWREWVVALVYLVVGASAAWCLHADGYYTPMAMRALVLGTTLFAMHQNLDHAHRITLARRTVTLQRYKFGRLQREIVLPFEEIVLLDLESTDAAVVRTLGLGFRLAFLGRQGWSVPMSTAYVRGVAEVNALRVMALKISHVMGIKPNPDLKKTVTQATLDAMHETLRRRADALAARAKGKTMGSGAEHDKNK